MFFLSVPLISASPQFEELLLTGIHFASRSQYVSLIEQLVTGIVDVGVSSLIC